ncbi:cation diffusion facilitator family transporter [Acidisphaera rubrifaciens]|uniref:Cation efflux protein n=1 Tax=Acidisphaera rubrifaciens HS-AP3 TaxID=1231350 RepID=A0A0D6PB72_9PROT|nr:cation diffusion facilitator family transporter [Acidisphaera rubrifaciens]GAN78453.1 cation efflux protein [Acidisphaera rubrifaciens HS-AP3]
MPESHQDTHAHGADDHDGHDHDGPDHEGHDHGGHDHGGHGHGGLGHAGHSHGPARHDRAFAIGVGLNTAFVVAEVIFGLAAGSVALVADAVHNLGDVLGLLLAWGAAWLGQRPPSAARTYGWGRSSILAALANAALLLIGVGAIAVEAVRRLLHPEPVAEWTVIAVALIGIAVNGGTALLFMRGREGDLNLRASFLHMAADAAVSAGVVVAAVLIMFTGWTVLDPLASLGIAAVITVGTWGLLRESVNLAMDGVPDGVARDAVHGYLAAQAGVREVHDLHIWALSTTDVALTAHLVCDAPEADRRLLARVCAELRQRFAIGHTTIQIETPAQAEACRLRPDHVV